MSTTFFAPATGDFDDFRAWQAELDTAALEPLEGPVVPKQRSRRVEADEAIRESLGIYRHRTHERRD